MQKQSKNTFRIVSIEDEEKARAYQINQIVRAKITGHKRPRSVLQNKWVHAMFRHVAANTENPDWDTPEKVKRNVKMAMRFFKDEVIVNGNRVFFELRSFAFDEMEQAEANLKYEEAKNICAKFLGVPAHELEARAVEDGG
jgi:hypothetical protein